IKKAFKAKSDEMELEKLKRVDIERGALVSAIRYLVHELNTPLNGLNGSLQILEEYIEENSEEHDLIKMSLESAGKLGRFVSAFNQYINISPEDFSPRIADIEKITLSALDRIELEMRQYGRENLKIEMRTEGRGPFECYAETKVLQDSLRECVLNSARRMESGTIIVCISEEADEVKLSVIDQGSGIEDKYKSRVFLPGGWSHDINYHSSIEDNPYEFGRSGYGFGLARIKKSIEMCGGRIDFDTEFGKGTSFFIFFPLNAPGNKANNG
ncbi:MAG: sensor histidine kinase, partial [Fibrobacterota bacterium]